MTYQQARELHRLITLACLTPTFTSRYTLARQVKDAAVSVMANLAESFGRGYRGHLHHAICIAKGSCAEVRSHVISAYDEGLLDESTFKTLHAQADRVESLLGGMRRAVAANLSDHPTLPPKRDAD